MRSAGNTRLYNDDHLRKLLNIVSLSETGLKISQVCALPDEEIERLLKLEIDKYRAADAYEYYISQLLAYGISYNEADFNQLINKCINAYGMIETYKSVLYPLLVRLGLMWRMDHICPAQEHFLSNIIRQKLFAAINELPVNGGNGSSWLLFLPEDEDHDIGLLFANYMLRFHGHKVLFLGSKVPVESVKDALSKNKVDQIMLFMVRSRPLAGAKEYLYHLREEFTNINLYIAGNNRVIEGIELPKNISWFRDIEEFEFIINQTEHVA
jgi:methanogenic corrinoid protein MtbC1